MKKKMNVLRNRWLLVTVFIFIGMLANGKTLNHLPSLVSTDWVAANSGLNDLVLLDVRTAAEYASGHIAASINEPFEVPFSAWVTMRDDLLLEMPETAELFAAIDALGITKHSHVVIITSGMATPPYPLAFATRVAMTLSYAGVKEIAIMDGGFNQWVAEGKPVTADVPAIIPSTYQGQVVTDMIVSREYVKTMITQENKTPFILIDARDAEVYSGEIIEPYAPKPGHILTAKSLPAVSLWTAEGKYKSIPELFQIASSVVGCKKNKEIVVYCGVGGYASCWWYALTMLLGYKQVKIYDGSAQEWVRYDEMVLD